ncbi:tetratricopeptide repeat protein [Pseudoduganella sp. GCM10020061]|uniref:tetratricopeptide repeat protein n=1 Tax=Pseudoduganella sp. GCM10020061 TaxID=3317345 RepID=UPI00363BCE70
MKHLALLLIAFLLGGCATTQAPSRPDTSGLTADALFGPPTDHITTDNLFAASPAMKEYLRSNDFRRMAKRGGALGLIDALYTRGQLQLEYDTTATRSAAETFDSKSGNCLSLVIMTAAFARELGLHAGFQSAVSSDTWTRTGDLYLSNMHVNVSLSRTSSRVNGLADTTAALLVDFLPPEEARGLPLRSIDEGLVVAMYLNNRAAEALAEKRLDDAYWWARKAVIEHPEYAPAINTLGVVYQQRGHDELAERTYRFALQHSPDSDVTMYNLIPLLAKLGKHAESQALAQRVSAIRKTPPFHYFRSGLEAMQRQDYALARDLFRKEVDRAPYYDEFHYWLGMAYLRLGENGAAREQLALALKNSSSAGSRGTYSAKLERLKSMRGSEL